MGVSTNTILFYGYCWGEEKALVEDDEWVDVVVKKRGIFDPWCEYVAPTRPMDYAARKEFEDKWTSAHRRELDEYYAKKRAIESEFWCDIGWHCSIDCLIPYVYVCGAGATVYRGYPKSLKASDLAINEKWDSMLSKFVAELGIAPPDGQVPQWWLASYWG